MFIVARTAADARVWGRRVREKAEFTSDLTRAASWSVISFHSPVKIKKGSTYMLTEEGPVSQSWH